MPPNTTVPTDPMSDFATFAQGYNGPQFAIDGTAPGPTPGQSTMPQSPSTHSAGGIEGFLERNAQTLGGIAGGTAGELLDPFGGGIAGAALGQGLGQEIKNLTTGTKTNPLEEAAIGGASQAGGDVVGAGASKLLSKASNVADRYGVDLLSQVGGTIDKRTARALDADGTTRFMSDLGVNPADHKTVSQGVMDVLTPLVNKGVSKAGPVDTTGVADIADNVIDNHMGIDGVSTQKGTAANKLHNSIQSLINKMNGIEDKDGQPLLGGGGPKLYDKDGNPTLQFGGNAGSPNVLNPGADPNQTLNTIRSLRSDAASLTGKGKNPLTVTDAARGEAAVKNAVADELETRLYNSGTLQSGVKGAGANDVVARGLVDDNAISKLKQVLPNTPKAQQFIDAISNAKTIKELRSAQAPFVNAVQLATEKAITKGTQGATNSQLIKGGIGAAGLMAAPFTGGASAVLPAAELALGTDTGKTITGNTLRKVATKIPSKAAPASVKDFLTNSATSRGASKTSQFIKTAVSQSFPHLIGGSGTGGSTTGVNMMASTVNGKTVQPTSPMTAMLNSVVNNYVNSIQNTDKGNTSMSPQTIQQVIQDSGLQGLSQYENYIKMTQPQLTSEEQSTIGLGLNSLSSLQQLAPLWEQAVSSGAGGGVLNNLSKVPGIGGTIAGGVSELMKNTSAGASYKTYMDNRYELASNIAKLVSNGGRTGGVQNTNMIEEQLPTLSDSPETAMQKFTKVASMVNSALQNVLQTPSTNTYGSLTSFLSPGNTSNISQPLRPSNQTSAPQSPILPPNLSFAQ